MNDVPLHGQFVGGRLVRGRLAFIVVNYFSHKSVLVLIRSLQQLPTACDVAVCVVDNSCDNDEWSALQEGIKRLESEGLRFITVKSLSNAGFAGGNNQGFRALADFRPEAVVVINPDVVVSFADLDHVLTQVTSRHDAIFFAPTESRGLKLSGLGAFSTYTGRSRELKKDEAPRPAEVVYPSGHFMAMTSKTWERLGGLSEDYFLFGEEADAILRLKNMIPCSQPLPLEFISVSHIGGLTSGASDDFKVKSHVTFRHATRSSIILFRKHKVLRSRLPFVIGARLAYAVLALVQRGPGACKAVLMGLRDAMRWAG